MKAVRRTRWWSAAAGLAAPLLVVLAGQALATPRPAPGGVAVTIGCSRTGDACGISVVVCGPGGRVTHVVRLAGSPPLLPLGRLTVRTGGRCGVPDPPVTVAPTAPPTTAAPTAAPTTVPPPTAPGPTPTAAPSAAPGAAPTPSGAAAPAPVPAGPVARGVHALPVPSPSGASAPKTPPRPAGPSPAAPAATAGALPPLADEPYDRGSGDAARWWLLTMSAVLLPALLAAVPFRPARRRR
ncbi:hypothetical protein [Streptomyces sp. NBC_01477]|uniref:hypothetical protein n=1 Tax=Streptomyces sp. NBC_01477 TaxID=2976015 RepID=UPI002E35B81E|nr:hypothetical protein [Streptomyces sp. NBC_01477]